VLRTEMEIVVGFKRGSESKKVEGIPSQGETQL